MSDHRISFHFPETDTPETFSAFDGLLGQRVDWTSCTDLEFIVYHVTETLVIDAAYVDVCVEFCAENTRVHWFVSVVIETCFGELFAKVVRCGILFRESNLRKNFVCIT